MKRGQSVIEYVLLVAISVIALVVGSNFVAGVKGGAFETHFLSAQYRINNPGIAIVGTPVSTDGTGTGGGTGGGTGTGTGTNNGEFGATVWTAANDGYYEWMDGIPMGQATGYLPVPQTQIQIQGGKQPQAVQPRGDRNN